MRRIQLYIDEELDDQLSVRAARLGRTRSELVRLAVREWIGEADDAPADAVDALVGSVDIDPVEDIDEVVYGG